MNGACKTCGGRPDFPGATRCANCWEVERRIGYYLESEAGQRFALVALAKALVVPRYIALIREQSGFTAQGIEAWVRAAEAMLPLDGVDVVERLYYHVWCDEHDARRQQCGDRDRAKAYANACNALRKQIKPFAELLGIELKDDVRSVTDALRRLEQPTARPTMEKTG